LFRPYESVNVYGQKRAKNKTCITKFKIKEPTKVRLKVARGHLEPKDNVAGVADE
jgi:hypothetical protein